MASCQGKKAGMSCGTAIFKCKKCGSVGCKSKGCTNNAFSLDKCLKCGHVGTESVR